MNLFNKISILVLIFVLPIWAQFNLSLSTGLDYYEYELNYETSPGFGIAVSYNFHPGSSFGLEYQRINLRQKISTPSGSDFISMAVSDVRLIYSYSVITDFYTLKISPLAGIGLKYFKRNAYLIQLGALGRKIISGTSESFLAGSLALDISKKLYKQVVLFVRPGISVYDLNNRYKVFSIAGGIDVRLF